MRTVLLLGASSEIGQAIAKMLAKPNTRLLLHYFSAEESVQQLRSACEALGANCEVLHTDCLQPEKLKLFVERVKREVSCLDALIYAVGKNCKGSAEQTSFTQVQEQMQLHFFAPLYLTQELLPHLKQAEGSAVYLGVAGMLRGVADTFSSAHTLSKGSFYQWMRSLAKDLIKDRVRLNMISPGYVENSDEKPPHLDALLYQRMIYVEEVARMANYLFSQGAKMITGQNMEIAGGVRL